MIRVHNVSKTFKIYASPKDRLKEQIFERKYHHEYSALSNISFEVQPGETLGIIGENGAGKSTLLKILSGVLLPDAGSVEVTGKVTGLLELGTGFNPELTGLQNIFMNGTFLGMTHDEIESKKDTIIEFAELGDFINEPIKTYSSGMLMRLGFAIAIHADPECFLVDEALSVGDAYFQQKCMRKIQEFKEQGGSIIFVSHDMSAVKTLCDKVVYLEGGKMIIQGDPKSVVDHYLNQILIRMHLGDESISYLQEEEKQGISTGEIELLSCKLYNEFGEEISSIESEKLIRVKYDVKANRDIIDPHFGFSLRNKNGLVIYQTNTSYLGIHNPILPKDSIAHIEFFMAIPLAAGNFSISIGVANKQTVQGVFEEYLLLVHDIVQVEVLARNNGIIVDGIFNMNAKFKCFF